jgi:hypothetical protein
MSVKVSFLDAAPTSTDEPKLIIPKAAVQSDQGGSFVWVVLGGIARRANVRTGRQTEAGVEVRGGLADGDLVVISAPAALIDAQRVVSGNP